MTRTQVKHTIAGKFVGKLAATAAGAAMVLSGALAASTAARAFDDKPSTFDPVLNVIGLGKDSEDKPDIDFRERPKLVVPKGSDLPPPVAGSRNRAANWPVDPDVRRRREAEAAARAPRDLNAQFKANPQLSAAELREGRSAGPSSNPEVCPTRRNGMPDCGVEEPASKIKQIFSLGSKDDELKPGAEPSREYLTEPPAGYRAPRNVVKATQSGPIRRYEAPSAGDYARGIDPNGRRDDD
ncbi:MAG TPA: hypothetical protein PKA55_07310 [Rhodoblastus sp.]|nr:hypothetical protein [Rhodoblastus sp.]